MKIDMEIVAHLGEVAGLVGASGMLMFGHVNTPSTLALYGLGVAIYCRLWLNTYEEDQ